jgi:Na+-transporting NADH:ubiquinone oxidoreductase subunit C
MFGFMALDKDTTTVKGFSFYAHGETPGLGGEVDNSAWKGQWPGKKIFDENFSPAITVIKGKVDKNSSNALHQIDGLSGATLTSVGVHNLIRYWIGADGFAKFLENVRNGGVQL